MQLRTIRRTTYGFTSVTKDVTQITVRANSTTVLFGFGPRGTPPCSPMSPGDYSRLSRAVALRLHTVH